MKALLWREWRWNRVIFVAGLVIFLLPYTITTALALWPKKHSPNVNELAYAFTSAALFSYGISQLTISCLAGNAIAGERSDRTAEFLAYLPVSRWQRVVSKLSFAAVVTLVIWGLNWLVVWFLLDHVDSFPRKELLLLFPAKYTAVTSVLMFGVAWLISSIQSSPTLAICAGLVAPLGILLGFSMAGWSFVTEHPELQRQLFTVVYPILSTVLGILSFGAGTWYFLKRIEP